jgi:hypothetical protein
MLPKEVAHDRQNLHEIERRSEHFDVRPDNRYVVEAHPGQTAPNVFSGLTSLQMKQTSNANSFAAVGAVFKRPGTLTLHLKAGTYRFTATRTAALFASVTPAT